MGDNDLRGCGGVFGVRPRCNPRTIPLGTMRKFDRRGGFACTVRDEAPRGNRPPGTPSSGLDAAARNPHPFRVPLAPSRMFHIDPSDPTPAEAQIVRTVRSALGAGLLAEGQVMPTVRQLAVDLRVGANAVARAYAELERQQVLETVGGVGVVVRASPEAIRREELYDELCALEDTFLRQAAELGFSLDDVIIHLDSRRTP